MSIWHQAYSTQFFTQESYLQQQYSFEILNHTSLNFARPGTPKDSHTAAMTAERRKLFEQLPRINTNFNKKCLSQESQKKVTTLATTKSPENIVENDKNLDVTLNGARVKDAAAVPNNELKEDTDDVNSRKKKNRNLRTYRRASAPAQGIDYYFKNAKRTNVLTHLPDKRQNNIPPVHIEVVEPDESIDNNEDTKVNHDHHRNHNANSMACSVVSPCDPPSLSPCSTSSSLSSSVEMLSPVTTTNKQLYVPQAFSNCWSIKSRANTIPTENSYKAEAHSYPDDMVGSLYDNVPWSPAVSFLANLANSTMNKPLPDDEGQQVGEFIIGKTIGHGGFSTVKQAATMDRFSNSMETAAVKIIKNNIGSDDNDQVQAMLEREIAIWRGLNHPNIVQMLSVEENDYATFIFSEYCPGGTLLEYVKKHGNNRKGLDEDEARNIFLEIAEAIRYLHNDVRLVHKDIKLDNILLDKDDTWKMCDFGLTEFQNSANGFDNISYNSVGGSLAYCAPEQLKTPTPLKNPSVDIWSLAVVLFAMITGQLPFSDDFAPRLQLKIINARYDGSLLDDAGVSDELKDLLKKMFKPNPEQRLTISQVLEHRWCER